MVELVGLLWVLGFGGVFAGIVGLGFPPVMELNAEVLSEEAA